MNKKLDDSTLLTLMLNGTPQIEIARMYSMTPAAICRRVHAPAFQEKLSQHRKAVIDSCLTKLTASADGAVDVLGELLRGKNQYLRFSSASRILSLVQDLSVQEDILKEIEALKRNQEGLPMGGDSS